MPGEFLQQFLGVIGKSRQNVLTPGWSQITMKNNHLIVEDATELALDMLLWRLLAASTEIVQAEQ